MVLGECGQELKLVGIFFQEIYVGKLPGVINEDNEGAMFLAKNQQVGIYTKHIDVKYHFVQDPLKDDFLELVYIRIENN